MFNEIIHILEHTVEDVLVSLPFLFAAYLLIEFIEHRAADKFAGWLTKFGKAGAFIGAVLGVVPQCGFSVVSANLYANRIITPGTLIAVFLSTSDEAIPVLLSNPQSAGKLVPLIAAKVVLATVAGLAIDFSGVLKTSSASMQSVAEQHSHCHTEGHNGILKSALRHTVETIMFIFIIVFVLNFAIESIGEESLGGFLMSGSVFQPLLAGLVGLIPNCAASVVTAQLYAEGAISFGSAVAGLSAGSGLGLLVLFRTDSDKAQCVKIAVMLFAISVLTGMALQFLVG